MKRAMIRIRSLKNQAVITDQCHVAECFFDRLRGLIGKAGLNSGQGMLFPRCNSIHMWFMKFSIDVIFLKSVDEKLEGEKKDSGQNNGERRFKIIAAHSYVRPWRLLPLAASRATDTLELPAGTIERCKIVSGDEVCLS